MAQEGGDAAALTVRNYTKQLFQAGHLAVPNSIYQTVEFQSFLVQVLGDAASGGNPLAAMQAGAWLLTRYVTALQRYRRAAMPAQASLS